MTQIQDINWVTNAFSSFGNDFTYKGYRIHIIRSMGSWSIELDLRKSVRYERSYGSLVDAVQQAKDLLDGKEALSR